MHPNKKALILVIFVVLVGLGVHLSQSTPTTTVPIEALPEITGEELVDPIGTFKNDSFSFTYPKDMIAKDYNETSPWRTNTETLGVFEVGILIPNTVEPSTNFRSALLTVGSSTDKKAIAECLIPTNGERAKGTETINNTIFTRITLTDAGAGNYYDTTSYRAIHDGVCYAVEYTIHTTNINNYSPEQGIKEFNTARIKDTLEGIVHSFTFLVE